MNFCELQNLKILNLKIIASVQERSCREIFSYRKLKSACCWFPPRDPHFTIWDQNENICCSPGTSIHCQHFSLPIPRTILGPFQDCHSLPCESERARSGQEVWEVSDFRYTSHSCLCVFLSWYHMPLGCVLTLWGQRRLPCTCEIFFFCFPSTRGAKFFLLFCPLCDIPPFSSWYGLSFPLFISLFVHRPLGVLPSPKVQIARHLVGTIHIE